MTIESITGRPQTPQVNKASARTEIDGGRKASLITGEKDDSVAITTVTQGIKQALGAHAVSSVDVEKVGAVKKALADGSYAMNADRIAKKMIQFESSML